MPNSQFVVSIIAFTFLTFVSPAQSAIETGATPPAADETLIYVLRVSRFVGGGGSFWVAVNDQTVDRLSNGRYAVVRAKAGRITLNLANAGMVWISTALDDRPGETVYLKWRLGDTDFREVSETEGREFLKKAKRSKGIETPLPNNEEIDVLANLSRMGFNLTRPASQKIEPDSEHGVITFFRREDGRNVELGIWSDQGFVSTLGVKQGVRLRVQAGDHHFLSANKGASILKAEVQAGKEYFAWLDYGEGFGGVRLTPISSKLVNDLKNWLEPVGWVEPDSNAITPRIEERGKVVGAFAQTEIKNPETKRSNLQFLGPDHAFDENMLKENEISTLITERYNRQIASLERSTSSTGQNSNEMDISGSNEVDISGSYVSDRIDTTWALKHKRKLHINLKQNANTIDGVFFKGLSGPINGTLQRGKVELTWEAGNCSSGEGSLSVELAGSILKGFLLCRSQGMQKYDIVFRRK